MWCFFFTLRKVEIRENLHKKSWCGFSLIREDVIMNLVQVECHKLNGSQILLIFSQWKPDPPARIRSMEARSCSPSLSGSQTLLAFSPWKPDPDHLPWVEVKPCWPLKWKPNADQSVYSSLLNCIIWSKLKSRTTFWHLRQESILNWLLKE